MKMKSEQLGKNTSVKVLGVNPLGLWLLAENEEHFLSFEEFPWFKTAPVNAVFNVEKQGRNGYCWPELDVDLTLDGIKNPDKYPLKAKH
ncbi:DUF2442 domain-containing protein [Vibrio breoganii]|uniref:DUF2442 domain-containing protein n=1 Tax=Vibrio breoganii TaxID=553239 RepID=UPI001F534AC8|nr:DUF2442 domain-containing protein [Vibrio breoganii]